MSMIHSKKYIRTEIDDWRGVPLTLFYDDISLTFTTIRGAASGCAISFLMKSFPEIDQCSVAPKAPIYCGAVLEIIPILNDLNTGK